MIEVKYRIATRANASLRKTNRLTVYDRKKVENCGMFLKRNITFFWLLQLCDNSSSAKCL